MKQSVPKTTFLLILLTATIFGFLIFLKTNAVKIPNPASININQNTKLNPYTSESLKISLNFLRDWFIEDSYPFLLVSNFKSSIHKNFDLRENQIEVLIRTASLCQDSLEKDLIYGGCGENQKILNAILKKDTQALSNGNTFYKFLVRYPDKSETWSYYLEKGKRILQISKTPDPSQFEKEFEDLVNSIRFID